MRGPSRVERRLGIHGAWLLVLPLALHFEAYHPAKNDGPDMVEMLEAVRAGRAELDDAREWSGPGAESSRLQEDERRSTYAESMIEFYYHLIRQHVLSQQADRDGADAEWPLVRAAAERLYSMKGVAADASSHANAGDGLEASGLEDVFRVLEARYGARH